MKVQNADHVKKKEHKAPRMTVCLTYDGTSVCDCVSLCVRALLLKLDLGMLSE